MTATLILLTKRELTVSVREGKHFKVPIKSKDYLISQAAVISTGALHSFPTETQPSLL